MRERGRRFAARVTGNEEATMTVDRRKYIIFGAIAAVSIVLDQWTKILARHHLKQLGHAGKSVIDGKFVLRYSENPGVAFGMLQSLTGGRIILTVVALAAFALVISYLRKTDSSQRRLQIALGLVGGGAIGNLIDRIALGAVTDFLVFDLGFWPLNPWPAFNIADAALVVGVALMALDMARPPTAAPTDPDPAPSTGA
jgi:signal peptidase II